MGDINQFLWLNKHKNLVGKKVLEIGSRFYSDTTFNDFRKLAGELGSSYLGVDMSEGSNVDRVVDFTSEQSILQESLGGCFSTVICCSVMEHVKDIFAFARNLTSVVEDGGTLFLSVPFTWEFHGFPDDYWRFTPKAIEYLFPDFEFPEQYRSISSHRQNDLVGLQDDPNEFCFVQLDRSSEGVRQKIPLFSRIKHAITIVRHGRMFDARLIEESIQTNRYFKPSCINMLGIKKNPA